MILLLLLAQAAPAAGQPAPGKPAASSWSILEPIANEPCRRAKAERKESDGDDIIVCAQTLPSQKLPYPKEAISNHPVPSNPEMTGMGALAAENSPCTTTGRGCTTGFGPPIMPLVVGAVDVAKRMFAKKPDKRGRVAISLEDTPPPPSVILP